MDRRQDPRTIVTPYAFSVHPDLLGRPLATPWQRLGALAIDGVVIFGLGRLGGVTLAIASALLLFWLAVRKPGKDVVGKFFRFSVGCLGVVILSITIAVAVFLEIANNPETLSRVEEALDSRGVSANLSGVPGVESVDAGILSAVLPDVLELGSTEDPNESQESSRDASTGDGRSDITDTVALDSISTLNTLLQKSDEELKNEGTARKAAEARLQEAEGTGFLEWLKGLLDDLGIGFGWGALYFTIIQAWWKGSSVGKKLFRIRVVMIDKRPLNLWLSFERVGGYAAGLATGMLGFAQIFWDPNRQAIHDKVSETIVIQDGKDSVPGPWMAE